LNYRQALRFLGSRGNEVQGMNLGLHRIRAMMRIMGDPHLRVPSIHVAGTNGKGSVVAMVDSIMRSAGLKTGLYTSPHLERVEERIRVGGRKISRRDFAGLISRIRHCEAKLLRTGMLDMPLTYFEILTACMFVHFAGAGLDAAVIEVGLGGSLDATNVALPRVCVITGISYDHQELLGETLARIAEEKAGIIKAGVPVICGVRSREALTAIRRRAALTGAPMFEIGRSCRLAIESVVAGRCTLKLETPQRHYPALRLGLAGEHQAQNAALAVMAVEALDHPGIGVREVRRGLLRTRWPGRLDEYRCPRRTLLDGAHNVEGARVLRHYLLRHGAEDVRMVFAVLREKDISGIGRLLFPLAKRVHLATVRSPRAAAPDAVAAACPRFRARFRLHAASRAALAAAWQECPPGGMVVVTGSLYLLGELMSPILRAAARAGRNNCRARRTGREQDQL
jgi:dihydrofolate synthase/folylpolyglutamate synthase